jgi:flagellum-specific peptidoglycan hydrolase FlgJ
MDEIRTSLRMLAASFLLFGASLIGLTVNQIYKSEHRSINPLIMRDNYKHEHYDFYKKSPKEGLEEALKYYNIEFQEVVYAQALLETGHFKSNLCVSHNNLFGLYDSYNHCYYSFNNWYESVHAYKVLVQYKYFQKPYETYYDFLDDIGYASDPDYNKKLKRIIKTNLQWMQERN